MSSSYLLTSSMESGIFLSLVSGNITVKAPEIIAMTLKMRVGMAGWMSARAATVERVRNNPGRHAVLLGAATPIA